MKKISILFSSFLILSALALAGGCQKFEEPDPFVPAVMEPTMTLSKFKSIYQGQPVEITDGSIILSGKVTSSDRSGNIYRSLYIEDETAGLEVKIGRSDMYNDYKPGQTLYIRPKYLCLGTYGGSVQLGAVSSDPKYETAYIDVQALIDRTVFRGAYGDTVTPHELVSASDLNDNMVSRIVRFRDVRYEGGRNGLDTWAIRQDPDKGIEAQFGEQNFSLGSKRFIVRTSGYASFASTKVGMEIGDRCDLYGILTKFRDTYQLVLLNLQGVTVKK